MRLALSNRSLGFGRPVTKRTERMRRGTFQGDVFHVPHCPRRIEPPPLVQVDGYIFSNRCLVLRIRNNRRRTICPIDDRHSWLKTLLLQSGFRARELHRLHLPPTLTIRSIHIYLLKKDSSDRSNTLSVFLQIQRLCWTPTSVE